MNSMDENSVVNILTICLSIMIFSTYDSYNCLYYIEG